MPSFDLGTRRIEYTVVRGTSRRYTYFRFRKDLILEVVLPRGRAVDVQRAITERSTWLGREYDRLSRTKEVLTDQGVMYSGRTLRIVFEKGPGDRLTLDEPGGVLVVRSPDRESVRELVRRWFLKESSAYVVKKVAELSPKFGVRARRVDVREIGKWGYCTRGGRLSFSWQLAALPERLREYVVLHELTHLVHFDHSRAFKQRLASVCPDFRAREKELDLVVPFEKLALP